jgi:SET domain-containing protein 6
MTSEEANANDEFTKQSQAFVQWLTESRGYTISPKVAVHDYRSQGQGRGLIAVADIAEGEDLFTIPRDRVIAIDTDTQEDGALVQRVPELADGTLDDWSALILYLMYHASKNEAFKPYFDVIPAQFNTPMFWDDGEAEQLLQGSTLVGKIGKTEAEAGFHENILPIVEKYKDTVFDGVDVSVNAFHRVGSLIMSYSFDVDKVKARSNEDKDNEKTKEEEQEPADGKEDDEEQGDEEEHEELIIEEDFSDEEDDDGPVKAMVPLADTLNAHSQLCNAHLEQEDDGSLVMRATSAIPAGGQIYNTYGDFPNSDLLRRYGYTELGGTASDLVEITVNDIVDAAVAHAPAPANKFAEPATRDSTLQLVQLLADWEDGVMELVDDSYDVERTSAGIPSTELLSLVNFLVLALFRIKDFKAFRRALKRNGNADEEKLTKKFVKTLVKHAATGKLTFREAVPVWRAVFEARIGKYPQAVQDECTRRAAVKSAPETDSLTQVVVGTREAMATEVLVGEVEILRSGLAWVEAALADVPSVDEFEFPSASSSAAGSKRKFGYNSKGQTKKSKRS